MGKSNSDSSSNDIISSNEANFVSDEAAKDFLEEKEAPVILVVSDAQTDIRCETGDEIPDGEISEPLFELNGIQYEWDIEQMIWDIIIEPNGNILVVENEGLIAPKDCDPDNDIKKALSTIDTLEYVGVTSGEFWGVLSNREYLYRFDDKLLAYANFPDGSGSVYDPDQYYLVCMYCPTAQDIIEASGDTVSGSDEPSSDREFPPAEDKIAPITPITFAQPEYDELPNDLHGDYFMLDGVEYTQMAANVFDFLVEDDGNIIVEGGSEYADRITVRALQNLYLLEYVGKSSIDEYLFRYEDCLLAVLEFPAAKTQSVYFKDYDCDESQFYTAYIYEPIADVS